MTLDDLRRIPAFSEIPREILALFVDLFTEERFEAGQVVFTEGSVSDRLFIIVEGEIEIKKRVDQAEGAHKLIAVLERGEFFGEMAVFLEEPRTADAVAKTDTVTISISREDLSGMLARNPESAFRVMGFFTSVITRRLRNTTTELVTVYETGRLINTARNIQELADVVLDGVSKAIGTAQRLFFVAWNEFNEEYEIISAWGIDGLEPHQALREDDQLALWLVSSLEPLLSFDQPADERFTLDEDSVFRGESLIAAPCFLHDSMLGFVAVVNRSAKRAFSYHQMILLSAITGYVSVALENLQFLQAEVDRTRLNQGKSMIHSPFTDNI